MEFYNILKPSYLHFTWIYMIIHLIIQIPIAKTSGYFKLEIQNLNLEMECHELRLELCLKEEQDNPSLGGSCSYGNVTSPSLDSSVSLDGVKLALVIMFNFTWMNVFTLVLEAKCGNALIDSTVYSGSVLLGQPPRILTHHGSDITIAYTISVSCAEHHYSPGCSKLCRPRHDTFGHYTCDENGIQVCLQGWTGENCQTALCKEGCHPEHGSCGRPGECRCALGWQGELCDECRLYPGCKHGSCHGSPWQCVCDLQWGGILCDKDLNPCGRDVYPCQNGGVCENNLPDKYQCVCPGTFTGKHCEILLPVCPGGCKHEGTCVVKDGQAYCQCEPGWTGKNCETELNECSSSPCHHGICVDQLAGFTCVCDSGWNGDLCQQDADECSGSPCVNALACHNHVGGYSCECVEGWSGINCDVDINECSKNNCFNGGTCMDTVAGFMCSCERGYSGDQCQLDVDECEMNPCFHGSTCFNEPGGYMCQCTIGYTGVQCETDLDACDPSPCDSSSTCIRLTSGFYCLCSPQYRGRLCELGVEEPNIQPCQDGCKDVSSSCEFHGKSYEDGESWQDDCNVCDCNHGNTQCTQVVCGEKNCILHPNQTEEFYYCSVNETCALTPEQCLTPPCLPWGKCMENNWDSEVSGIGENETDCSINTCVHLVLDLDTSHLQKGLFVESLCMEIRRIPCVLSLASHMTVDVTCHMVQSQVQVIIVHSSKEDISTEVIHDMYSVNGTLMKSITHVLINNSVVTGSTQLDKLTMLPILIMVSCVVLILGLIIILILVGCYNRRRLKHSTSQHQSLLSTGSKNTTQNNSIEITANNIDQGATCTVSRHHNPLYGSNKLRFDTAGEKLMKQHNNPLYDPQMTDLDELTEKILIESDPSPTHTVDELKSKNNKLTGQRRYQIEDKLLEMKMDNIYQQDALRHIETVSGSNRPIYSNIREEGLGDGEYNNTRNAQTIVQIGLQDALPKMNKPLNTVKDINVSFDINKHYMGNR